MTENPDNRADPPVTVSVTRHVKPGREAEFEEFVKGITAAAMRFPGHLGANVFRPGSPGNKEYRVIFKFDHESNLKRWDKSEEKRAWYAHAEKLAQDEPTATVTEGLEAWFTVPERKAADSPPDAVSRGGLSARALGVAIGYINDNLTENPSLEEIAGTVNLSPHHFSRLFKESVGLSPHRYLISQRVERARRLLEDTELTVADVAEACGFSHQQHLTRHFSRLVGVPPATYRRESWGR